MIYNRHMSTVNRNSTIKDHDAPECWICAMKSVPDSKRFHQTCRSTVSFMRAHMQRHLAADFLRTKGDIKIVAATPDFRTARQSGRVHRRAASSDKESSHGAAI